jgi:hypothetical protein
MKMTDVKSLPQTADENTENDLNNMCQWGILPDRLSDIAGQHQQDQLEARVSYFQRFTPEGIGQWPSEE